MNGAVKTIGQLNKNPAQIQWVDRQSLNHIGISKSEFFTIRYPNQLIPLILFISILLLLLIMVVPCIQSVFDFAVRMELIGMALGVSLLGVFLIEVLKAWRRRK